MSTRATSEPSSLPPPPRRARLLSRVQRRVIVGVVVLAALAAGVYFGIAIYREWDLRQAIAEADRLDPGWRFDDQEAARELVPPSENSAAIVVSAAKLVPPKWGTITMPDGRPLTDRMASLPLKKLLDEAELDMVRAELAKAQAALKKARELADRPRGRYVVTWRNDLIGTLMPHVDDVHRVKDLLLVDALLRSREGDSEGATLSCRATINAGRSLGDEPAEVSQLVRMACTGAAVRALERTLAAGTVNAPALEKTQALLADEETQPSLLRAMRAARVSYFQSLELMRAGRFDRANYNVRASSIFGEPADILFDGDRAWKSESAYLRWTTALVEMAKQPTETHSDRLLELPVPSQRLPRLIAGLAGGDEVLKQVRKFDRARAEERCAIAALAAERYRMAEQRWPERLDDLVPRYLAAVPADPFDGQPLRLRRLEDGMVIYSVGPDRIDLGGQLARGHPDQPGSNPGFQLWDNRAGISRQEGHRTSR